MTEKLSDTTRLLALYKSLCNCNRTILVIRHSERISFRGIPMEQWDDIPITENGFKVAKDLGRSIASHGAFVNASVYGWGYRRCVQTAGALAEGMSEAGIKVRSLRKLDLDGPISDAAAYKDLVLAGKWEQMLDSWQRGEDIKKSLKPIHEYSPPVFREILHQKTSPPGELCIVVTHDIHVLPLASHALGKRLDPPDYLDGIVIGERGNDILVGYGDVVHPTDVRVLTH